MPTALNASAASKSDDALSELLPYVRSLAQLVQFYHWRVKGPLFGVLHPLFGELYAALVDYSDNVAERIAQLGGVVPWRVPNPLPLSESDGSILAKDCGKQAQQIGSRAYVAMEALQGNDRVFLAKLEELQGGIEKLVWQIEQHANR
jgi:DNA-binding ferritin-like protein